MQIIWEHEPVSTEDLQRILAIQGRNLTDGCIRRNLSILMKKGFLNRIKDGRAFLYESVIKHEEAADTMLGNLRDRVFRGSVPSMVATLLKSDISHDELAMVKKLVDDAEKVGE